jgi:hypothetical protein
MHPVSRGQHLTDEELRERMQIGEGAQSLSKITANNGQCFIFGHCFIFGPLLPVSVRTNTQTYRETYRGALVLGLCYICFPLFLFISPS